MWIGTLIVSRMFLALMGFWKRRCKSENKATVKVSPSGNVLLSLGPQILEHD